MKEFAAHSLAEIGSQEAALSRVSADWENILQTTQNAFSWQPEQVFFIGCGTSFYIAAAVHGYFVLHGKIPSRYLTCYEMELHLDNLVCEKRTLVVSFSRCASTSEVRSAVSACRSHPLVQTLSISCDEDSIPQNDHTILCRGCDEKSIVMTRSFTAMVCAGMLMTRACAGLNTLAPKLTEGLLGQAEDFAKQLAPALRDKKLMVGLGQGALFGMAGEASIKLKEMCLIPTEIYYTMEYRHGPISIADESTVFFFFTDKKSAEDDARLAIELKALGSMVIAVGEVSDHLAGIADHVFRADTSFLPQCIFPAQYLGVYWALEKGLDPDVPRNLTKAVEL